MPRHSRRINSAGGTVAIKLTDLMARPHLDLIVDKFAVKSEDIPDEGLVVGRDPARCTDGDGSRLRLRHSTRILPQRRTGSS